MKGSHSQPPGSSLGIPDADISGLWALKAHPSSTASHAAWLGAVRNCCHDTTHCAKGGQWKGSVSCSSPAEPMTVTQAHEKLRLSHHEHLLGRKECTAQSFQSTWHRPDENRLPWRGTSYPPLDTRSAHWFFIGSETVLH